MKQKSIDFRELLEQILPLDEMLPTDRLHVHRALQSGVSERLESAALFALSRLENRGALRRLPRRPSDPASAVRYESRDDMSVITVPWPESHELEGVLRVPRAALPQQASASLDQVRRLLHLDDLVLFADPRQGDVRRALVEQLSQVGREFLHAHALVFVGAEEGDDASLHPTISARTRTDPEGIHYVPDAAAVREWPAALAQGVGSAAMASVTGSDGKALGHLEVIGAGTDAFSHDDLSMIALLADYASGVLERAERIEKLMFIDPMTSAYNRSYFDLQLQNEMARAERERASMALAIVDIDDFKSFNTKYGYEAGNAVLTGVAQALRHGLRPFDTIARWGGEEFGALLTAPVSAEAVMTISERLRGLVGQQRVEVTGLDRQVHAVTVTVSIGVALSPEHGRTPDDLWRAANRALLVAKQPPKNRVVFYEPNRPGESKAR